MLQNDLQCQKLLRILRNIVSFSSTNIFVLGGILYRLGEEGRGNRGEQRGTPLYNRVYRGSIENWLPMKGIIRKLQSLRGIR